MQDDRNIVIYRSDNDAPTWASNTSCDPGAPVSFDQYAEVGYAKRMWVRGKLYRNGQFAASVETKCDSLWGGLRGRALAVMAA
jgi:hypothetical protein